MAKSELRRLDSDGFGQGGSEDSGIGSKASNALAVVSPSEYPRLKEVYQSVVNLLKSLDDDCQRAVALAVASDYNWKSLTGIAETKRAKPTGQESIQEQAWRIVAGMVAQGTVKDSMVEVHKAVQEQTNRLRGERKAAKAKAEADTVSA